MSLRQKTFKGLFWSAAAQVGRQVCQFLITAILARVLSPADFGLLAMATVFLNFILIFSEMGISSALIQKHDVSDRHYSSAFWLNVMVGIGLAILSIFISPLVAGLYNKPQLVSILAVLSLNFIISSFTIIQKTILTKDMDFRVLALRDIIALALSGIIGIWAAYNGLGVWSLVLQTLLFSLFDSILLWSFSPWRPKFVYSHSDIKDIFHFGAGLTGFNILNFFSRNMDQLLIGRYLGAEALGFYSLAYKIMLYPLQNVSWAISRVMFPAFSAIQNQVEKVRTSYLGMINLISLATFPMMCGLFILAPEFITVLYGSRWMNVSPLIRILCICGLFQSIGTTVGIIYLSQGKVGLQFKLQVVGSVMVTFFVLVGLRWGIQGVAILYTIQAVLWVIAGLSIVSKIIRSNIIEVFRALMAPLTISLAMMTFVYIMKPLFKESPLLNLTILTILGIAFYIPALHFSGALRTAKAVITPQATAGTL